MIKSLAIAAISSLLLAGAANASNIVEWSSVPTPGSGGIATSGPVAGVTVGPLTFQEVIAYPYTTPSPVTGDLQQEFNDWGSGQVFGFSLTVAPGSVLTLTGFSVVGESIGSAGTIDFTGSVLSASDLGTTSVAVDGTGGGANPTREPSESASAPTDLVLAAGTYAVSFDGVAEQTIPFPNGSYAGIGDLSLQGSVSAVPEPASLGMLAVGSIGLLVRRRRQV